MRVFKSKQDISKTILNFKKAQIVRFQFSFPTDAKQRTLQTELTENLRQKEENHALVALFQVRE